MRGCQWCNLPKAGPQLVYYLRDANGELIYVGVTANFPQRIRKHIKRFGDELESYSVEQFPSRTEALVAEATAILTLRPRYNAETSCAQTAYETARMWGLRHLLAEQP